MGSTNKQENLMRWILFYIFVILFVIIVLITLVVLLFDVGNLLETERNRLFNVFLIEIGLAVIALFYSVFNLRRKEEKGDRKIRLNMGEFGDVRKLIGKQACLVPIGKEAQTLTEKFVTILDDNGPFIPIPSDLPKESELVSIKVELGQVKYFASFVIGTYLINMFEEEE